MTYPSREPVKFENYFKKSVEPAAVDLLKKFLLYNPNGRISAIEALNHEYFFQFDDLDINNNSLSKLIYLNYNNNG